VIARARRGSSKRSLVINVVSLHWDLDVGATLIVVIIIINLIVEILQVGRRYPTLTCNRNCCIICAADLRVCVGIVRARSMCESKGFHAKPPFLLQLLLSPLVLLLLLLDLIYAIHAR
jgi:hypothetical protein